MARFGAGRKRRVAKRIVRACARGMAEVARRWGGVNGMQGKTVFGTDLTLRENIAT